MFLFFAVLVVGTVCAYKGPGLADDFFGQETDYAKGWHTAKGDPVTLDKLNKTEGTKVGEAYSIFNTIPENISEGDALCFRSKNIFYQVYIDGELRYDPYVPEGPVYTKSYGTEWNYVNIPANDAGKEIEIRMT